MACRLERRRAASKHSTAAAVDTLRDSAPPPMGMVTVASRRDASCVGQPTGLVPEHQGEGRRHIDLAVGRPASRHRGQAPQAVTLERVEDRLRPSPATTTGMWRTEPADARTVFGLKGSTVPSLHTTASAPAASSHPDHRAGVARVTDVDAHHHERRPGQLVEGGLGHLHHGQDGLGRDRVGHPFEHTRRQVEDPGSSAEARVSRTADTSGFERARSSTNTASTGAPASSALCRSLTPSTTKAPSERRVARRANSRRRRWTRWCRKASPVVRSGPRPPLPPKSTGHRPRRTSPRPPGA